MKDLTDKCPACGKFVSEDDGFYIREYPNCEMSVVILCCDEACAKAHEKKYFLNQKKEVTTTQ